MSRVSPNFYSNKSKSTSQLYTTNSKTDLHSPSRYSLNKSPTSPAGFPEEKRERRVTAKYRELVSQICFNVEQEGYFYSDELSPGARLFNYLARDDATNNKDRLQLWIPDTVIYNPQEKPIWVYSNSEGFIEKTSKFRPKHIVSKLGDMKYQDDIAVVMKTQLTHSCKTNNKFIVCEGNSVQLLNTKRLQDIVPQLTESECSVVLQRYIKCKGSNSSIVRVLWGDNQSIKAWSITSKVTFDDESEQNLINRFTTNYHIDHMCHIVPLQGVVCNELGKQIFNIYQFISTNIGRPFIELICDFIKDEDGQWWFLQVKSFRIKDGIPKLSGIVMADSEPSLYLMDKSGVYKKDRNDSEALKYKTTAEDDAIDNIYVEDTETMTPITNKFFACNCCGIGYPIDRLPFTMSSNMIKELKINLGIRCGKTKTNWLRINTHSKSKNEASAVSKVAHEFGRQRVCTLCYNVYRAEQKLRAKSSALARTLGIPAPTFKESKDGEGNIKGLSFNDPGDELLTEIPEIDKPDSKHKVHFLPQSLTLGRIMIILHALHNVPKSSIIESPIKNIPQSLRAKYAYSRTSFCNSSINKAFDGSKSAPVFSRPNTTGNINKRSNSRSNNKSKSKTRIIMRRLIIRLKILLTVIDLPIDAENAQRVMFNEKTTEHNRYFREKDDENEYVVLPLNFLKVFYFLVKNTPAKGPVEQSSGLWKMLQNEEGYVTVSLLWEGDEKPMSTTKLQLYQFRSDYVNVIDEFIPLNMGLDTTELHVTVGLDRTKDDVDMEYMQKRLAQENLFMLPSNFFTCDPIPPEWLSILPHAGLSAFDKKCSMGIWKDIPNETISKVNSCIEGENNITIGHKNRESTISTNSNTSSASGLLFHPSNSSPLVKQPPMMPNPLTLKLVKSNSNINLTSSKVLPATPRGELGPSVSKYEIKQMEHENNPNAMHNEESDDDESDDEVKSIKFPSPLKLIISTPHRMNTPRVRTPPHQNPLLSTPVSDMKSIDDDTLPATPRDDQIKKRMAEQAILREGWGNSIWQLSIEVNAAYNIPNPNIKNKDNLVIPPEHPQQRNIQIFDKDDYEDYIIRNTKTLFDNDVVACQVRYNLLGIDYTLDGFIDDETAHEAKFKRSYKHFIRGSIHTIKSFFNRTKELIVEIYCPTYPNSPVLQIPVAWGDLATSRCIDGKFDALLQPGEKASLPTLKYPPYISISAYMYRIGPMNKNDIENYRTISQLGRLALVKKM